MENKKLTRNKREKNPKIFSMTFNFSIDDEDPRISDLARMFKEGLPIDSNGFIVIKGKDLLIYALKDFHKRWTEKNVLCDKKILNESDFKEEIKEKIPEKQKRSFGILENISVPAK